MPLTEKYCGWCSSVVGNSPIMNIPIKMKNIPIIMPQIPNILINIIAAIIKIHGICKNQDSNGR